MKLTNVTLKLAPTELKELRGHGYWAKYITEEVCAHANQVPCQAAHRCKATYGLVRCFQFESEHDQSPIGEHDFVDAGCSSMSCADCEEDLG